VRVIIAGSRQGVSYREVERAVRESGLWAAISVVISGGALGVDRHGERWADANGREVERHPVSEDDWERHGKAAGPMRNRRMAEVADACIVVWDGESRGSKSMIYEARRRGIPTHVAESGAQRARTTAQ
jgi:hypothetical protein